MPSCPAGPLLCRALAAASSTSFLLGSASATTEKRKRERVRMDTPYALSPRSSRDGGRQPAAVLRLAEAIGVALEGLVDLGDRPAAGDARAARLQLVVDLVGGQAGLLLHEQDGDLLAEIAFDDLDFLDL